MKIEGKVALITGAASGIGKAYSETLLEKKIKGVVMVDFDEKAGHATESEFATKFGAGRAVFVKANVTDDTQLEEAFKETVKIFGGLDIVSCTAGVMDEKNYKRMLSINLEAVITGSYLAFDYIGKGSDGKCGVVINTASVLGLVGFAGLPAYCASKFGVVGLTRALSQMEKLVTKPDYNIRFNAICPFAVDTALLEKKHVFQKWETEALETFQKSTEVTGFLKPSNVAEAFIRLIEDDSLNGACVVVSLAGQKDFYPGEGMIPPPKAS